MYATQAEQLYNRRLAAAPGDATALIGLARVIIECQIPLANSLKQRELSERATALVKTALEAEPRSGPLLLPPSQTATLSTVVVSAAPDATAGSPRSERRLDRMHVLTTPGGAGDVMQNVQLLPGATGLGEGGEIYARGGDPSETAVLLNGGRIIYASKFETLNGGLFGVLDPMVLTSARFSAGGFSARHGNALSAVLDVEADGRPDKLSWRAGINTVQGGVTARAPLGARAGAWASVRAMDTRALLWMHDRSGEFPSVPNSVEAIASVIARPSPSSELRALALVESDKASRTETSGGFVGSFRTRGSTRLAVLSGRTTGMGPFTSARTNLSFSQRVNGSEFGVLDRDRSDFAGVFRMDADRVVGEWLLLRAGLEHAELRYRGTGRMPTTELLSPGSPSEKLSGRTDVSRHSGGYTEAELSVSEVLRVTVGLRLDKLPGESSVTADPRIAIGYRIGATTLRVSGGEFHQGSFRPSTLVPKFELPFGNPRRSRHIVAGLEREGPSSLRLEVFFKTYGNYGGTVSAPSIAGGRSSGAELFARWPGAGAVQGWLAYSYLRSHLELVDGSTVPSPFNVTHTATLVASRTLGSGWEIGTTTRVSSGQPYTPIVGAFTDVERGYVRPIYGDMNSERLPLYARVDARLTRYQKRSGGMLVWYMEGMNLLGRSNVIGYTYDASFSERRSVRPFFRVRTLVFGVEALF